MYEMADKLINQRQTELIKPDGLAQGRLDFSLD